MKVKKQKGRHRCDGRGVTGVTDDVANPARCEVNIRFVVFEFLGAIERRFVELIDTMDPADGGVGRAVCSKALRPTSEIKKLSVR